MAVSEVLLHAEKLASLLRMTGLVWQDFRVETEVQRLLNSPISKERRPRQ